MPRLNLTNVILTKQYNVTNRPGTERTYCIFQLYETLELTALIYGKKVKSGFASRAGRVYRKGGMRDFSGTVAIFSNLDKGVGHTSACVCQN